MLRGAIFDFGGVLAYHPSEAQMAECAAACGLELGEFLRAFWGHRVAYDRGGLDAGEYWRLVAGRDRADGDLAALIARDNNFWGRLDDRAMALVSGLRGAGVRTAILSNLPRSLGEALRARSGFLEHFDQVTFSYEIGVVKPDPRIYRHCLEGLGVAADETLFLDDREENIEAARALGIRAVVWPACPRLPLTG